MRALSFTLVLTLVVAAEAQRAPESSGVLANRVANVIGRVRTRPVDSGTLEEAIQLGFELLRISNYEGGLSLFTAVIDANRLEQRSVYGRALALFNLGRIADAEQGARAAIELSKTRTSVSPQAVSVRADALVLLGVILAVKGDNSRALAAVREAVKMAPESFDAQFALGRALYGAGDPKNAALAFRKAISLRPDHARSRFFLATTLESEGDYDMARVAYSELIALEPDNAEGHLGLGVLLVKLEGEKTEEGTRELLKAISLNADLYEARVTVGRTLIKLGRASEALEHLTRAVQLAPNNPEPHFQLAMAYRRLGKIAEADAEAAKVKEINSSRRGTKDNSNARVPSNNRD